MHLACESTRCADVRTAFALCSQSRGNFSFAYACCGKKRYPAISGHRDDLICSASAYLIRRRGFARNSFALARASSSITLRVLFPVFDLMKGFTPANDATNSSAQFPRYPMDEHCGRHQLHVRLDHTWFETHFVVHSIRRIARIVPLFYYTS